jgi:Hint module
MSELAVGDYVQVGPAQFSEVFMFTHKVSDGFYAFLRIATDDGPAITLSSTHYLYVNTSLVPAETVLVGDTLTLAEGRQSTVIQIDKLEQLGLFNPQTLQGNIVVDGILASTYTTAITPVVAHASLQALRSIYRATGWSTRFIDATIPTWLGNMISLSPIFHSAVASVE